MSIFTNPTCDCWFLSKKQHHGAHTWLPHKEFMRPGDAEAQRWFWNSSWEACPICGASVAIVKDKPELQDRKRRLRLDLYGISLMVVGVALIAVTALWKFQETPRSAYDRGHEQGCKDIIAAYYRNQPYYKAILGSRMYEDTIQMGWVIRRFQDSRLPDPTISIEHDTIVLRAWDSLGYDVLTGAYRYTADSTETSLIYDPWPKYVDKNFKHLPDSTDMMPAVESSSTLDSIKSSLTVRRVYSIPPAAEGTTYVDTFYKRDGVWRNDEQ